MSDDGDDDLKRSRELVEKLEPLLKHPSYEFYQALLQRQVNIRMGRPPEASDGIGAVLKNEFEKGELSGLMLAMRLPAGVLDGAKTLLEEHKRSQEAQET